jgi:hypothetical protein
MVIISKFNVKVFDLASNSEKPEWRFKTNSLKSNVGTFPY